MSDFSDIKPTTFDALGLGVPQAQTKDGSELGQSEFFELMVAQLNNQDPLNPLESNEFLSQVAQFSTVSGIQSIERSIGALVTSMESNQALQASTLVGREVLVPTEIAHLESGDGVTGAVEVTGGFTDVTITISTPGGEVVRQIPMGTQPPGVLRFEWDGLGEDGLAQPPGNYVVSATGTTEDAERALPVLTAARVESVTLSRNPPGVILNLDGIGSIGLDAVTQIL